MFNIKNMEKEDGFSLVEILVALIAVSCISAALAPVITKKLKSNGVSIGGGGIGGKTENVEFVMDCSDFGVDCTMCFNDKCVLCTKECNDDQYVNTPDCTCGKCVDVDPNCIECSAKKCKKCAENYGLNLSTKKCYLCTNGQSSDGMSECASCPENYFCVDGNKTPCATNQFAPVNSTSCTNCTDKWPNCAKCNPRECLECEPMYRKKEDGSCMMSTQSKVFTTPGNHTFEVPGGVTEMEVTLVSGGAGGGAGSSTIKTQTYVVSGNGGITADSNNAVSVVSNGLFTWTVPTSVINKYFKVTLCGGGGGGGGSGNSTSGGGGGSGAYLKDKVLSTSSTTLPGQIGGGGGYGGKCSRDSHWAPSNGQCAFGGGGSGRYQTSTSCNSSGAGSGGREQTNGSAGYSGGYSGSGSAAGAGVSSCGRTCNAGAGGSLGGGGGATCCGGGGGGGGAATMFYAYSNNTSYTAGGGGGGGGGHNQDSNYDHGGPGGGGGGVNSGKGGGSSSAGVGGTNGVSGSGATGGAVSTIFGSSYCNGGNQNTNGKNGAMRITYIESTNGGTGGGSGQIVPKQKIQVTPGDTLTITVGSGGNGGIIGKINSDGTVTNSTSGSGANNDIISKITDGSGIILITTATSITTAGATGGNPDGTTVGAKGYITSGRNTNQIAMEGFTNTDGETANSTTGGSGGKTTIEGAEMHCSPGASGTSGNAGGDATGYGGCGGGGGGAGANGGKGAGGYVKITYGT